jgi:hypothetical protein
LIQYAKPLNTLFSEGILNSFTSALRMPVMESIML